MKLEEREHSTKSEHALAAANIKRELKEAFPGLVFRVTSEIAALGYSAVNVVWVSGPTADEVGEIAGKYGGRLTDWNQKYGHVVYVNLDADDEPWWKGQ